MEKNGDKIGLKGSRRVSLGVEEDRREYNNEKCFGKPLYMGLKHRLYSI